MTTSNSENYSANDGNISDIPSNSTSLDKSSQHAFIHGPRRSARLSSNQTNIHSPKMNNRKRTSFSNGRRSSNYANTLP